MERRPSVVIGTVAGEATQELGRVEDAVRLGDGRILVADEELHKVLIFDTRGRLLASTGRKGEGPGEFSSLTEISPYRGDSVVVYDLRLRRLSILDTDGAFNRSVRVPVFPPWFLGTFADGTFAVQVDSIPRPWAGGTHAWARYYRLDTDGDIVNALGPFRRFQVYPVVLPNGHASMARPPFAPRLLARVHAGRLYLADGGDASVDVYSPDGRWVESIRFPSRARPVTASDITGLRNERLEGVEDPNRRRYIRRMLEETPFPEHTSAFQTFLVDSQGHLWLRPFPEEAAETVPWQVVDSSGRWLGSVPVPSELTVFQIGDDFLLGRRTAEYDVHQVVLHDLKREIRQPKP